MASPNTAPRVCPMVMGSAGIGADELDLGKLPAAEIQLKQRIAFFNHRIT